MPEVSELRWSPIQGHPYGSINNAYAVSRGWPMTCVICGKEIDSNDAFSIGYTEAGEVGLAHWNCRHSDWTTVYIKGQGEAVA